ncbi:MAG TPA: hypothetical protein PL085_11445 [Agriterribacter sp.]|uniref:hypothetical protein n=1 Tax=Agriterribacter sp. TaxID=2821509 RepID=UPI002CCB1FF4|nr:hypothetical protein [Agriterribacter sp.]HRQ17683.1 hypothetical protein [Agriterribacter sp.]
MANKSGQGRKPDQKTLDNLKEIKRLYKTKSYSEVAEILGLKVATVRNAITKNKFKKASWHWDKPEEDYLLKNWQTMSIAELQEGLKRHFNIEKSKWAVINKYRDLAGLRK